MTYLVDQKVVYFSVPALGWHCYKEKVGVRRQTATPRGVRL